MRLCDDARKHSDYRGKLEIVNGYVSSFTTKTMQGSVGWQYKRAANIVDGKLLVTIGGSEMPTVIGKNKFRPVDELVVEKVAFFTTGVIPDRASADMVLRTQWGHICEPYSRIFICNTYDCDFFEIQESIVHQRDKRVRYSPDGVGVIRVDAGGVDRIIIALLELKNPYDRIANKAVIPEYYEPQVDTGMDVIEITEAAMYVECNFRCQSLADFGKPTYNGKIHFKTSINGKKGTERYQNLTVYGSVLAFFYRPKLEGDIADAADRQLSALIQMCAGKLDDNSEIIDFGATNESILSLLMAQLYKGHLKHYSFDRVDDLADESDRQAVIEGDTADFLEWCNANDVRPYGVLPMSIFQYSVVIKPKRPNFVDAMKPYIDRYTARVHDEVERCGGFHEKFRSNFENAVTEESVVSAAE